MGYPRPQAPFIDPASERLKLGLDALRRMLSVGSPVEAQGRQVLHQQNVRGDLLHLAPGKPYDDQAATPGRTAQGALKNLAANGIEDDVHPAASSDRLYPLAQIFVPVVDEVDSAIFGSHGKLFGAAGGGDDLGPRRFTHLTRREAGAAGRPIRPDRLARLQAPLPDQPAMGSAIGDQR